MTQRSNRSIHEAADEHMRPGVHTAKQSDGSLHKDPHRSQDRVRRIQNGLRVSNERSKA